MTKVKLYIDTSNSDKIVVGFGDDRVETDSRVGKSQQLLEVISQGLEKRGKTLKDLTEIEIKLGPGSFTGLKVGAAVANALGWSLGIPVNGKRQLVEPSY